MLDVSGISSKEEALRAYYVAVNENNYELTQDDLNYLRSIGIDPEDDLDVVEYEALSDDEVEDAREVGKQEAREATGNNGKTWDDSTKTGVRTAAAATGAVVSCASIKGVSLGAMKGGGKFLERLSKAFGKGSSAKNALGEMGSKGSAIVGLIIGLITAILRLIFKPNEENNEVLTTMQDELNQGQSDMTSAQGEMEAVGNEILEAQANAEAANADGQAQMNNLAGQMYEDRITITYLQGRKDAGETLSGEEEKALAAAKSRIAAAFDTSESISDGIVDTVGGYQAFVYGKQAAYDEIQVGIEELVGKIEFTANIDETTKTLAILEQCSSGLNMASLAIAGARMFQFGPWVGVAGLAVAAAGIGMEIKAMSIQSNIYKNAEATIGIRTDVTDVQKSTGKMLDVERQGAVLIGDGLNDLEHDKLN